MPSHLKKNRTVRQLQQLGSRKLADIVWHPDLETDLLLATALKRDRSFVYAHPDQALTEKQYAAFRDLLRRRARREPFAYLTGSKEFLGAQFKVDKRVLIPRSDTEILAEEAISLMNRYRLRTCIDVGTGSGAVIVSVARLYGGKAEYLATDISSRALAVARANKRVILGTRKAVSFLTGDLLMPAMKKKLAHPLLVVSNPPYLTLDEAASQELKFEPRLALSGGSQGLDLIERLLDQFARIAHAGDHLIFEIGAKQGKKILRLAKKHVPNGQASIVKDYAGFDRIVHLVL